MVIFHLGLDNTVFGCYTTTMDNSRNEVSPSNAAKFPIKSPVVFKASDPYHNHYGRVVSYACGLSMGWTGAGVMVRWDGDLAFPDEAGTVSFVPFWTQRLQPVSKVPAQ